MHSSNDDDDDCGSRCAGPVHACPCLPARELLLSMCGAQPNGAGPNQNRRPAALQRLVLLVRYVVGFRATPMTVVITPALVCTDQPIACLDDTSLAALLDVGDIGKAGWQLP